MRETLEMGGLVFEVRQSARRKTVGLTVDRGGNLVIHCPDTANHDDVAEWARGKLLWVYRKLALKEGMLPKYREPEYVTGETFSYLGRSFRLVLTAKQKEPLQFDGLRFILRGDARGMATEHFRQWYTAAGREWIAKRVSLLVRRGVATPERVEVRDLGFRWGSCGKSNVVFFNWKIMQLPVKLADYVLLHELVHLRYPRHDAAFWLALERCLPDWRQRQESLKAKALELFWCDVRMVK